MAEHGLTPRPIQNQAQPYQTGAGNAPAIQALGNLGTSIQKGASATMTLAKQKQVKDSQADLTIWHSKRQEAEARLKITQAKTSNPRDIMENNRDHMDYMNGLIDDTDSFGVELFRHKNGRAEAKKYLRGYKGSMNAKAMLQAEDLNNKINGERQEYKRQQIYRDGEEEGWKDTLWMSYYAPKVEDGMPEAEAMRKFSEDKIRFQHKFQGDKEAVVADSIESYSQTAIGTLESIRTDQGMDPEKKAIKTQKAIEDYYIFSDNLIKEYHKDIDATKDYSAKDKRYYNKRMEAMKKNLGAYQKDLITSEGKRIKFMQENNELSIMSFTAEAGKLPSPGFLQDQALKGNISMTFAKKYVDIYGKDKINKQLLIDEISDKQSLSKAKQLKAQTIKVNTLQKYESFKHKMDNLSAQDIADNQSEYELEIELAEDIDPSVKSILKSMLANKVKGVNSNKESVLKRSMTIIDAHLKKEFEDEPSKYIDSSQSIRNEALKIGNEKGIPAMEKYLAEKMDIAADDAAELEIESAYQVEQEEETETYLEAHRRHSKTLNNQAKKLLLSMGIQPLPNITKEVIEVLDRKFGIPQVTSKLPGIYRKYQEKQSEKKQKEIADRYQTDSKDSFLEQDEDFYRFEDGSPGARNWKTGKTRKFEQ